MHDTRIARPPLQAQRTPCVSCPFHANPILQKFTPKELAFIQEFKVGEMVFAPGATILEEGNTHNNLYTQLTGWSFRYKLLTDGRRQILNFSLPSDFLGLQAAVFKEMTHSVEALTQVTVCVFSRTDLWRLFNDFPAIAFDLTWIGARTENLLSENLVSVGRRSARERLSNALLQMFVRAEQMGMTRGKSVDFPFTQQHLADALGLSLVHTNKTIQLLMREKLFVWRAGRFELLDSKRMASVANYEFSDPTPRPFV